ncbi:bifunctional aminoglycoside phosphotransferase/ATP-binding protein [Henriciella aquimarina]|uniref:bifunctional aminoglycoside phosphotransferase/ATP-binding protein n=1 Tax=Henriciella aquimarina TaxID=545261 RepID=UPI0009FE1DAC|nr:AAA family ATPase [Henriciella aquimarina]
MTGKTDGGMTGNLLAQLVSDGGIEADAGAAEQFETHLSHVLLAGDQAYKLKKPVKMPFVDFSTLEQRHAACQAELEINRRMGSKLYRSVTPIVKRPDGRLQLDGEGETVDWVVIMKRFETAQRFDKLAEAGKIDDALARRTADRVADMHAGLSENRQAGHTADYRAIIRDLRRTEAEGAAALGLSIGEPSPYDALDAELSHIDPLLEARRSHGKVRRTHGDLHLRNLCLYEGEVSPFDALEFDDRLATTDVLYDLAFLLMDLRQSGLDRQANIIMNRYWDSAREEEEALALLPFFMSLRAAIRMAVAVEAGNLDEAEAYRQLSHALLRQPKPVLVAIGGLSGTGKSTVAASLAPKLPGPAGARFLRTDVLRKQTNGRPPEESKADPCAYRMEKRVQTYKALAAHAARAVHAGASVIADGTFQVSAAREAILGVPGAHRHAIWLETPLATRLARVSGRTGDASDADVEVALSQNEPGDLDSRWRRVDASGSVEATTRNILQEITDECDAARASRRPARSG